MVSINWCLKVKNGIELINPNKNMSDSYMKMAEESLQVIKKVEDSNLWIASTSYYTMYYCLYSLMMKIGVKCEIHKCSIELMKEFLTDFYNRDDVELIKTAFELRNDLQYYPDRLIDKNKLEFVRKGSVDFLIKTKEVLSKLSEREIGEIRDSLNKTKNNLKLKTTLLKKGLTQKQK